MKIYLFIIAILVGSLLAGCSSIGWSTAYSFMWVLSPGGEFEPTGSALDYKRIDSWAAHPNKKDESDKLPTGDFHLAANDAPAVFFVHATTYISSDSWNQAQPTDETDEMLDNTLLANQASVFNGCCQVYAPRYRQATFYAFADKKTRGRDALDFAYADVSRAFDQFLIEIGNQPFILAGHSQGSAHIYRLIQDKLVDDALKSRMLLALLPGYPIPTDFLSDTPIPACQSPTDLHCLVSWNVLGHDHYLPPFFSNVPIPKRGEYEALAQRTSVCHNPLSWNATEESKPIGYLGGFYLVKEKGPKLLATVDSASCQKGFLMIDEPKDERFSEVLMSKGWYHVYEYALFWGSIRQNLDDRIRKYQHMSGAQL